jgi:hypothetical protein
MTQTDAMVLDVARVVATVLSNGAVRATKYLSPTQIIRVTRRRYAGKVLRHKRVPVELSLTIGRPNYREREAIRRLKKAGEPFPVKKIQLSLDETRKVV